MVNECPGFGVVRWERRLLGWAGVVSLIVHVVMVSVVERLQPTVEEVAQRVTFMAPTVGGKFVMRVPRITKRLELRKLPRQQGIRIERGVVAVAHEKEIVAWAAVAQAEAVVEHVLRGAGGIGGRMSRVIGIGEVAQERGGWSQIGERGVQMREVGVTKELEQRVDLSLELLDVNNLDTGRYRAMIIQNPRDKQALKGFIHIARVFSQTSQTAGVYGTLGVGGYTKSLFLLATQITNYTGLKADFIGHITLDDERLMEIPLVFWQGGTLTENEIANLARYLKMGGFIYGPLDFLDGLEKYTGLVRGRDYYIERLQENHPLFTSFFDLKDQPSGRVEGPNKADILLPNRAEGLMLGGRLCALSDNIVGLGSLYGSVMKGSDGMRVSQFLINVMVYVLTQEGSITHQLMQMMK